MTKGYKKLKLREKPKQFEEDDYGIPFVKSEALVRDILKDSGVDTDNTAVWYQILKEKGWQVQGDYLIKVKTPGNPRTSFEVRRKKSTLIMSNSSEVKIDTVSITAPANLNHYPSKTVEIDPFSTEAKEVEADEEGNIVISFNSPPSLPPEIKTPINNTMSNQSAITKQKFDPSEFVDILSRIENEEELIECLRHLKLGLRYSNKNARNWKTLEDLELCFNSSFI